jgi:hypothetical protein
LLDVNGRNFGNSTVFGCGLNTGILIELMRLFGFRLRSFWVVYGSTMKDFSGSVGFKEEVQK